MKKTIAVFLLSTGIAQAGNTVGVFYDTERQLMIAEHNWFHKINDHWSAYGFNEAYRTPEQGFPAERSVFFGKSWVMREVAKDVSVGVEIEHGYNNAGMYSRSRPFEQDKFRAIPKIGVSWKLN
jgi:hypothetical protein